MKNPILLNLLVTITLVTSAPCGAQIPGHIGSMAPDFKVDITSRLTGKTQPKRLADYRGKWLVLDFWSKTCKICIQSMPKLNSLAQAYQDRIEFLLIGINDKRYNAGIEKLYGTLAKQLKLKLNHGFDTAIFKSYRVRGYPHVVIISPEGQIKTVTFAQELTAKNLDLLLNGEGSFFEPQPGYGTPLAIQPLPEFQPIAITNGPLAHRSELKGFKKGDPISLPLQLQKGIKNGGYRIQGTQLDRLYLLAYFGMGRWNTKHPDYLRYWPRPILELADTSKFENSYLKSLGNYTYSIQMADSTLGQTAIQQGFQQDLSRWFGYAVRIEEREMLVYRLTVSKSAAARLRSSSTVVLAKGDASSLNLQGVPVKEIFNQLSTYHPLCQLEDATGIDYPIDLQLSAPMNNFEQFRIALKEKGLFLEPAQKRMKVLVISNRK